jgi:uncharacterized protein YdeI (BOF family)
MKNYSNGFVIAGLATLVSTSALAAIKDIKDMGNGSQVNITGTVDTVRNERKFLLRDASGTIAVEIASNQSVVLKQGDTVAVTGVVDKGMLTTDINASQVTVHKNVAQAVGDTIESRTGVSLEGATTYSINSLPKEGLVKVSGKVTDVDNEKKFTVADDTGSIKVDVQSPETAALTKGAEVTVIGYVDSGMLGKDINARKVLVVADAAR